MPDTTDEKVLTIVGTITVGDLAEKLALPVAKLVGELFKNGIVAQVCNGCLPSVNEINRHVASCQATFSHLI